MNTDIIEFDELNKKEKTEILEEHKEKMLKKQEEFNDIQALINHHISLISKKLDNIK